MADFLLYDTATLMCPHGGQVQITAANTKVTVGGTVLVQTDTMTIAGCAFTLPGGVPSPCVQVQWVVPDTRVTVGSTPTLNKSSTGLCIAATGLPQGPVQITVTQPKAQST